MDYEHEARTLNFLSGLILGAVLGAGIALLTAPESGRKTRKKIKRVAGDVREKSADRFDELAEDIRFKVDDAVRSARKRLSR